MIQKLRKLAVFVAIGFCLGQPLQAVAWTTKIDCEGGTLLGKVLEGLSNTFSSTFSRTVYSNAEVSSGSQSCKMGISQGAEGWGEWGGIYSFPSKLAVGSQLWIRVKVFVPTGFNYTGQPWLKFMRVHTASPANSNQGYLDLYVNPLNGTVWDPFVGKDVVAPFSFLYEGKTDVRTVGTRPANNIQLGKWETYEVYYKLDTRSKDAGGSGEIRIWKNNQLLGDLTNQTTLADAQTYAESFYLFTYWNGTAPATQSLYVDDIVVTSDTPAGRDANGNPFIGGGTTGPIPKAPAGISVQ